MVNFQPNKIRAQVGGILARLPVLPIVLAAAVSYYLYLSHWPPLWRLAIVLPVFGVNLLAGHFFERWLRRRSQARSNLGLELVLSFATAGIFLLLPEALFGATLATGIVSVLLAWLLIQYFLKRAGLFYTAFAGLFIFLTVQYSFHLLHFGERVALNGIAWYRRAAVVEAFRSAYRWQDEGERRLLSKRQGGALRPVLELAAPPDLYFHDPVQLELDFRYSLAGIPVAVYSANARKVSIPPVLVLFDVSATEVREPEQVKPVIERLLGHRANSALISELSYLGRRVDRFPALKGEEPAGAPPVFTGIFWSYTDAVTTRTMHSGVYVFGDDERRFMLFLREPVFLGTDHHPDVLFVLRSLALRAPGPERNAGPGETAAGPD